jgi:hypothetical protein
LWLETKQCEDMIIQLHPSGNWPIRWGFCSACVSLVGALEDELRALALLWSLAGLVHPPSSDRLSHHLVFGCGVWWHGVVLISPSITSEVGGHLHHQVMALDVAIRPLTELLFSAWLGYGEGPRAPPLLLLPCPWHENPRHWLMATFRQWLCQLVDSWLWKWLQWGE